MLHLSPERLAALADDEPSAPEAVHLASCAACAEVWRLHRDLLSSARKHGAEGQAPLTDWNSLAARLVAEGLIVSPGAKGGMIPRGMRRSAVAAAALALMAGGVAAGRMSAGASFMPWGLQGRGAVALAFPDTNVEFSSKLEALNIFLSAQRDYQRAAAYLAARDDTPREAESTYLTRLAALEDMHAASLAALREAPTDPVLNSYYVSTLNARDATRQQVTQMVPVGSVVKSY